MFDLKVTAQCLVLGVESVTLCHGKKIDKKSTLYGPFTKNISG
jgi:hypothetical protein